MKAIINAKIYDYVNFIDNGYIIFDHQILAVGKMEDFNGHFEVYDAKGKLIIPGLLNGHTHIYSALFRGAPLISHPESFQDILDQIWWKFDKTLNLEDIKASAYTYGEACLKHGVTALIDHHASGTIDHSLLTIDIALHDLNIKHLLCFETSDRFDIQDCINENHYAIDRGGHFGLHASMSLSDETLNEIEENLKGSPIHIHVAESIEDVAITQQRYHKDIVNRLKDFNLLNEDSILAHCVHINDAEAKIIKESKCYIAINPTSNLNNAVGLYNNKLVTKYDIPILVGTDGLGANIAKEYQYLYYLGKMQTQHPSNLTLEWIRKTIINGYDYFNRRSGQLIGAIQQGYSADFILIDYQYPTPMNQENILYHLFYGVFDQLKPFALFINGEKYIDQYEYMSGSKVDLNQVKELWSRL
ncbi:MAG: amidohydrolase family protein [Clostridia bacterium]|nr:amidohydrolase family protein [Clostridia bacterium]